MSVVTLDGQAFPSVLNVRVDGRLRRYVPCDVDRDGLLALAGRMRRFVAEHGARQVMHADVLGRVADKISELCGEVAE